MPSFSSVHVSVSGLQLPWPHVRSGLHGQPSVPHGQGSSPLHVGASPVSLPTPVSVLEPPAVIPGELPAASDAPPVELGPVVLDPAPDGAPQLHAVKSDDAAAHPHRKGARRCIGSASSGITGLTQPEGSRRVKDHRCSGTGPKREPERLTSPRSSSARHAISSAPAFSSRSFLRWSRPAPTRPVRQPRPWLRVLGRRGDPN